MDEMPQHSTDRDEYVATEEELALIDEGLRSEQTEPFVTFEEALRRARIRHRAWLNADLDMTA